MIYIENDEQILLNQFDELVYNNVHFEITAKCILTDLQLKHGNNYPLQNYKWYIQIAQTIIDDNLSSVTQIEKIEFVKLHKQLVKQFKHDNPL